MSESFDYDVFLSHSAKDKPVVRDVAERLKKDGRMPKAEGRRMKAEVPFHPSSFELHPFCPRSHVLVLCMSANAFGSDWAQLETSSLHSPTTTLSELENKITLSMRR